MIRIILCLVFLFLISGGANAQIANARLGLSPSLHWIGDITAATTVYYTNDQITHSDLGPWSPNSQYDFFDDGSTLCHQAWSPRPTSGVVPPPVAVTCQGEYLGSGLTDANGHFNQHKTPGPARRWDIWNYQNQVQIDLQVVDSTGNFRITSPQSSWQPVTSNSYASFIIGLPQQANCFFLQATYALSSNQTAQSVWGTLNCGWGPQWGAPVTYVWPNLAGPPQQPQGYSGQIGEDTWLPSGYQFASGGTMIADYTSNDNVGVQQVWSIYIVSTLNPPGWVNLFGKNSAVRIMHVRFEG